MELIEFDGHSYEVEADANGSPNRLGRYNEEYGVHISLRFADSENPALINEIKDTLKDIFIAKTETLTDKNGNHTTGISEPEAMCE